MTAAVKPVIPVDVERNLDAPWRRRVRPWPVGDCHCRQCRQAEIAKEQS